jgi:RHS repeat-associated protein
LLYLGAQQRRADPATGLIQMGARSYSPSLGRFMSEDPVFGHLGVGASVDRYLYVWDNPLNLYDLNGQDVCVPSPFGDACAGDAAEDVGGAASDVANSTWDWTAPGRGWVGDRAQDFWKATHSYVWSCLGNGAVGAGVGAVVGAGAAGAGAAPGAIAGGISGCAQGVAQQGLDDLGQDELSNVVEYGSGARDVSHLVHDFNKEAPWVWQGLRDLAGIL